MGFLKTFREIFEVLFLTGIKDWIEAGKVNRLGQVEFELFFRYITRLSFIYIKKESRHLKYPSNNFYKGETPHRISKMICRVLSIGEDDVVYDLGCGRGKFVFFVNLYTGARCIGIDLINTYIENAVAIVEKLKMKKIDFVNDDICRVNLSNASVVLLHGSTMSEYTHRSLLENIVEMKKGSRFVSYSIPYEHPRLELIEKKSLLLSWGYADLYFYRLI